MPEPLARAKEVPMNPPLEILVATRDATYSDLALRLAVLLAAQLDASLTVLSVGRDERERAGADAAMAEAVAQVARSLPEGRFRSLVRVGHPAEEILDELETGAYALAVLGEREHRRRLTRLVIGSTAERVIEHSPCAVAVAKGRVGEVRNLLLCDSGVSEAPLVDVLADQLPGLLRSTSSVTVLHVMSQMSAGPSAEIADPDADVGAYPDDPLAGPPPDEQILARDIDRLEREGVKAKLVVRHGLVVAEVLAEAANSPADLVVIGAHRGDGWRRVLLGDLAREIFRGLNCSVLVMRPPRR